MSSQPSNSRTTKTKRGEPDGFFTCNLTWQYNSLPNVELSNETTQTCWRLTEFVTLILIGTVNNDAGHDNEAHAPGNESECSSLFRVIASADIRLDAQLFEMLYRFENPGEPKSSQGPQEVPNNTVQLIDGNYVSIQINGDD